MKRLSLYSLTIALGVICLTSTLAVFAILRPKLAQRLPASPAPTAPAAFVQSEKITIKMVPEPNQTVRMRMVQEMEMEMAFEGNVPPELAARGPMKMAMKTAFAMTQKVGAPNKQGNIESEVTYDEVSTEATMNGQPMPLGDEVGKFAGKKLTATFDKQGNLTDFKIPPGLGLPEESFKQMLKSFYGNLPATSIVVGGTVSTPLDFTIPLPMPGAAPMKMDGQVNYKLVSVEKEPDGRIARFDQTIDGKMVSQMEIPSPNGNVKMSIDFKMNGGGDLLMNVDKGVVKSSEVKSTFGGKIKMAGESSDTKLPDINLQGTMKVTITGGN
jgi:hypothetical protein